MRADARMDTLFSSDVLRVPSLFLSRLALVADAVSFKLVLHLACPHADTALGASV